MTNTEWQLASKAHMAYTEENPEWMAFAVKALNKWGSGDFTLQHIVALALEDAYRMGQKGEPIPEWVAPSKAEAQSFYSIAFPPKKLPPAPPPVIRRTRPTGSPELEAALDSLLPAPTVIRRTRPAPPPPAPVYVRRTR